MGALDGFRRGIEVELQITKELVLTDLQGAIEIVKTQGDAGAMIAGWREIARMCGYYSPERVKVDLNVSGKRFIDRLEQMSDAELLEVAANPEVFHQTNALLV